MMDVERGDTMLLGRDARQHLRFIMVMKALPEVMHGVDVTEAEHAKGVVN